MDPQDLISILYPLWLRWMLFLAVRVTWHRHATALLKDRSILTRLSAELPPRDPATPFLLATMRDGVHAAAELAIYAALRRGVFRFGLDSSVQVIQADNALPTPYEQCALAWAIAHHGRRPGPTPYWEHPAFSPLKTLGRLLHERGLGGALRLSENDRKRTHTIAAGFLALGAGVAAWLGVHDASIEVVISPLLSGALQYLWCRSDERLAEPTSPLLLSHLATDDWRLNQASHGQPMRWHDLMFSAGLHGVPAVWSAKLQMLGSDGLPITTGPPARWFDDTAARAPVAPTFSSSYDAADGSH